MCVKQYMHSLSSQYLRLFYSRIVTSNMVTVQIVNQEWFWYAPSDWTFLLSLALSDTNSMIDGVRLDSCSSAPSMDDGDNRRALGGNEVDGIEL